MQRIALVTGANRGIGREVCGQLAARGFRVIASSRSGDAGIALDIADEASIDAAEKQVRREFGRLDLLVNNAAAFTDWSELPDTADLSQARRVFDVNLFGTWRVIQRFLPLLRESAPSRIVNVSSGAGSHGDPQFGLTANGGAGAAYGISKAAVNALTAKFAAQLVGSGVSITAVCPGFTATRPGMEAMGARPASAGGASVVWSALADASSVHGAIFRDGRPLPW